MKPINLTIIAFAAIVVALLAFSPGDTDPWKEAKFNYYWAPTDDTITDDENDTLTNADILSGFYYYNYAVKTTELGDTVLVSFVLQEENTETGTNWYPVDTLTFTNQGFGRITGGPIYGLRHRLIVNSVNDTQTFTYDVNTTYKWDK